MRRQAMIATVLLVLTTSCTADPPASPGPGAEREPLAVTVSPMVGSAFDRVLPGELADGDAPPPDADCAETYRWAREKGAYAAWGLELRVTVTARRYAQVVLDMVRVKHRPASHPREGTAQILCGDIAGGPVPEETPLQPAVELFLPNPAAASDPRVPVASSFGDDGHPLDPGESITIALSVGSPRLMPPTDFTVQLVLAVNGTSRVYELDDGGRPFAVGSFPDGGGYHASAYLWCPGAPGRLTHFPAGPDPVTGC